MAHILSYKDFCASVPERTKTFVNEILPYFNHYIDGSNNMTFDGYNADEQLKRLVIMLNYKYNQQPANKTQLFLGAENYTPRPTLRGHDKTNFDYNQAFVNSISTFCFFEVEENYSFLTPEHIIENSCNEYHRSNSTLIRALFGGNYEGFRRFIRLYSPYKDSIELQMRQDMKTEFYGIPTAARK